MCFSLLIEAFLVSPATRLQDNQKNSPEGMKCSGQFSQTLSLCYAKPGTIHWEGGWEESQLGRNPLPAWNQAFLTLRITCSKANSFQDMRNPAKASPAMETAASMQ